ncbi:triokinase/FMN cyclase isoform X8 [Bombus vancouverensis nearcticus]|uniref:triokinase/FMN cyclase isoform X8 n=1 Tax=Bombus vancouverensis nearcticus TaxID=2705178 RepID=UPI00402B0FAE
MCDVRVSMRFIKKWCSFTIHKVTQKNDFVNSYVYFSVYPTKILFRTMKSLVNEVNNAVTESLFGLSFAFPQLEYQESHKVVLMPNLQERKHKVSLICGGGSGHEPFAAGYVGNGMLAAAVAGSIYAAPPSKHISYAIDRVSQYNNTGILMVVPNYTGDCLNFGIAIEKARQKGLKISEVIVNEDCSIPKEEQGVAGKRGLTGIIFVMKIAGALAEQGLSLEEVTKTAHDVLQNIATYSVGLTACAIPGSMNIEPLRVYAGLLMTSLNSAGVHITLLKLSGDDKSFFLGCLDAPTVAPKWPGCVYSISTENARKVVQDPVVRTVETIGMEITLELQNLLKQCLKSACESIIQKETHLNDLDRGCGDGDTGSTLNRLATGILGNLDKFQFSHPSSVFTELAHIAEEEMGGTSGALYCLFFTSITTELVSISEKEGWLQIWARTFRSGLNCLIKYGKAKPGDRSMVDALNAFCDTFENLLHKPLVDICDALKIATWKACESTKNMKAKVGRASYVKQTQYFQKVDAGAYAVATCVEAITNVLKNFN